MSGKLVAEGNQVHIPRVTSSVSSVGTCWSDSLPEWGDKSCTGHGVWWWNFGQLPGGDCLVTPRFQPNFSAGAQQASPTAIFSLNESRAGKHPRVSSEQGTKSSCVQLIAAACCLHSTAVCTINTVLIVQTQSGRAACPYSTSEGPANTASWSAGMLMLLLSPWHGGSE